MKGYQREEAKDYIVSHLDKKQFQELDDIERIVEGFINADLRFMHETGVLDAQGNCGDQEYSDDDAFEYIFDDYLSSHVPDESRAMKVASLLSSYMELQLEYLKKKGLVTYF